MKYKERTMSDTELNVKNFTGSVMCKHWLPAPDGRQYIAFFGNVSILSDEEMLGFKVSGQETNWIARIQGPTSSVNVPGCQVQTIFEGPASSPSSDSHGYLRVP